jgi:hypothetical protein
MVERVFYGDLLRFIQDCVSKRRIFWTYHVNMRLKKRAISREEILEAVGNYEIIENYPDERYFPSCLVFAKNGEKVFHVVFALDYGDQNVRVVTAYRPDSERWEPDLKTRRKS